MSRAVRIGTLSTRRHKGRAASDWRLPNDVRGSALIEFAFVLMVFLMLVLGIMGFGQALYAYHFVSHAAKSAARWAAVNGSTCGPNVVAGTPMDGSCNGTDGMNNGPVSASDIANYVAMLAPPGITSDPTRLMTTATWPVQASGPTICKTTPNAPGCTVKVQVSYTFNFLFPLIGSSTQSLVLSSDSQMVVVH